MSIFKHFKQNPIYYLQRLVEILKILFFAFISTFAISSIYLLHKNIIFDLIKICYYYLLAKCYVTIGFENFFIGVPSISEHLELKAIRIANDIQVIKIYNYVKNIISTSIVNSLIWGIFVVMILAFFFIAKAWWKYKKKDIIRSKLVRNLLLKAQAFIANLLNSAVYPVKIAQRQDQYLSPIIEKKYTATIKSDNIQTSKKPKTPSENYRIISDNSLPYPILKRVELIESEEDLEPLEPKEEITKNNSKTSNTINTIRST
jgi:hypothetical protein